MVRPLPSLSITAGEGWGKKTAATFLAEIAVIASPGGHSEDCNILFRVKPRFP